MTRQHREINTRASQENDQSKKLPQRDCARLRVTELFELAINRTCAHNGLNTVNKLSCAFIFWDQTCQNYRQRAGKTTIEIVFHLEGNDWETSGVAQSHIGNIEKNPKAPMHFAEIRPKILKQWTASRSTPPLWALPLFSFPLEGWAMPSSTLPSLLLYSVVMAPVHRFRQKDTQLTVQKVRSMSSTSKDAHPETTTWSFVFITAVSVIPTYIMSRTNGTTRNIRWCQATRSLVSSKASVRRWNTSASAIMLASDVWSTLAVHANLVSRWMNPFLFNTHSNTCRQEGSRTALSR